MRELLPTLLAWRAAGEPFVLATVVATAGGGPRELGAAMAVRMVGGVPGEVIGSVSGGCVEAAVIEEAARVLADGRPRLHTYGLTDAEAVGLTCGGTLSVVIEPGRSGTANLDRVHEAVESGSGAAVVTVIAGPPGLVGWHRGDVLRANGYAALADAVARDADALVDVGESALRRYRLDGCPEPSAGDWDAPDVVTVFFNVLAAPPRLIILGALDYAASLASIGRFLGYRVTVCDARPVFATAARFPDAHDVVVAWPHRYLAATSIDERTAICVLTHDAKFDVPALAIALRSAAVYVGAMGSRRTCEDREQRLREAGITEHELTRLSAPIGLDLGASTSAETAVSIAAELVSARRRGSGEPLRRTVGRIHH
ncbi:XdhC family protein [Catenulispora pinisilvae]|uniref:XdhC family protein n=1 Tax=Catenulispora pinisilvae TaxID=2705253 RepID=UPI001891FD7A|nr:XdhC/CoxI family protein [Catenulispora pinisilvae]